jgi:hypothetical protein
LPFFWPVHLPSFVAVFMVRSPFLAKLQFRIIQDPACYQYVSERKV